MRKARSDCDVIGNNHGQLSAEKFADCAARWALVSNFVDHVHTTLPAVPSLGMALRYSVSEVWVYTCQHTQDSQEYASRHGHLGVRPMAMKQHQW